MAVRVIQIQAMDGKWYNQEVADVIDPLSVSKDACVECECVTCEARGDIYKDSSIVCLSCYQELQAKFDLLEIENDQLKKQLKSYEEGDRGR